MNFMYTVNPYSDEPIMLINKHIGTSEEDGVGIMGDQFQSELLTLDSMGKRLVNVWITSEGGSVLEGEKIYAAILNSKAKVDTYCMGLCASTAAWIFQAGRKRVMSDYGKLMFHNPYGGGGQALNAYRDSIATMICERSSKTKDDVLSMMNRTTWVLASEENTGLWDEILPSSEANKGRLSKVTNEIKEFYKESVNVLNSLAGITKNQQLQIPFTMKKITNKLGLVDNANEESILAGIEAIENKLVAKTTESEGLKNKVTTLEAGIATKEAELKTLKDEKEASDLAAKTAKEETVKNSAKVMIEGFAKEGRIKNEAAVIEKWINKAVLDMTGTKEMIEDLPINKTGVKIINKNDTEVKPYSMASKMAEITNQNKIK
jgi:ATP-dependent protease ClpP protease subunit